MVRTEVLLSTTRRTKMAVKPKLGMKPEVKRIFEDLEAYHDYCRLHMCKFDERDLYRRGTNWERMQRKLQRQNGQDDRNNNYWRRRR
jgi:hypothetical protein